MALLGQYLQIDALLERLGDIQQLILIPHRDLHLLPLNYLFRHQKFATIILPSAQLGLQLQQLPPQDNPRHSLLSVEHPYSEQPLLFAEIEAAFVAYLHRQPPPQRLPGKQATKEAVNAQLKQHQGIFHFTGHAEHNLSEPRNSALAMANNEKLTWQEIIALKLPSYHLICLSACETGLTGQAELIDEFIGLVSAFLAQNTRYVLSTLWTVSEISAALLVIEFYRRWQAGFTPAFALKAAQKWLRQVTNGELAIWYEARATEIAANDYGCYENFMNLARNSREETVNGIRYSNPYHWAGFIITGYPD